MKFLSKLIDRVGAERAVFFLLGFGLTASVSVIGIGMIGLVCLVGMIVILLFGKYMVDDNDLINVMSYVFGVLLFTFIYMIYDWIGITQNLF